MKSNKLETCENCGIELESIIMSWHRRQCPLRVGCPTCEVGPQQFCEKRSIMIDSHPARHQRAYEH